MVTAFQYLHSRISLMVSLKQVLLHMRREEQQLWFQSGILQPVFSVTAVHLYVHMLQFVHLSFQQMR